MTAQLTMHSRKLDQPGRYTVTLECADDLTDDELILMLEFFKAELFATQNHERGDAVERNARFRTWCSL
jgi:hypothetical protein